MDTDTDRSQILADFQAGANIDDIEHALAVLEAVNWDLTEALNMAMASDNPSGLTNDNPGPSMSINGRAMDLSSAPLFHSPPEAAFMPTRTVFNNIDPAREVMDDFGITRRVIIFHVQFKERLIELQLKDSDTVEELLDRLGAKIDKDKTEFTLQWPGKRLVEENYTLRELGLPRDNTLRMVMNDSTPCAASSQESTASTSSSYCPPTHEELSAAFKLEISVTKRLGIIVRSELTEPGTKTVQEIKESVAYIHGIPTSTQTWTGWPGQVTDEMTLASCQLSTPVHKLTVCSTDHSQSSPSSGSARAGGTYGFPEMSDSESDHDYDMLGDDQEMDMETPTPVTRVPLIPAHIDDATDAAVHFNTEFIRRYGGVNQPLFYAGSFKDAVDNALQCPAADRRLLAVYLHHDSSIAANVFCTQVLCSETVANFLTSNFVTWGWDLTLAINRTRFVGMFELVVGKSATEVVRRLDADDLPVLVILGKVRGSLEIISMSRSSASPDEMMTVLLHAEEVFEQGRSQDVKEEEERKSREEMKRLQDAAYEESLALDRVKQEEQQRLQAEEDRLEREAQETRKWELETMEAMKQSAAETIPDEPAPDCPETVSKLRFRCPDGGLLNRRFLGATLLGTLFNYLVTKGYTTDQYKVLRTYPRLDLTQEDVNKTLEELKLCPQETLTLESK